MFALREIAVSLTFFVLFYCLLSAIVASTWRFLEIFHASGRVLANLLFAVRILPLASAITLTLAFVVPSFQVWEPRYVDEKIGVIPFALGGAALLLIACGASRVLIARVRTSQILSVWLKDARPTNFNVNALTLTYRPLEAAPPIVLVGVRNQQILLSEAALKLLSDEELQVALKHEIAHMQSRDNLKKLIFRCCPFPGMNQLETAWCQASELAADGTAVCGMDDAVDLASALVKLSRLVPIEAAGVCTVGFVTGSIRARVARLLEWNEAGPSKAQSKQFPLLPFAVSAATLLLTLYTYSNALRLTHEMTEWMVR
jgi:beta-lactamase regulating signal transducer with metallopeptidase domain